ncbi:Transcription factor spt8 [Purpureocillium takamizusanense]|uniref:Transcription factor spt8 n=1 Tax=Purpureocillium takamizusanense TaxID=2060973 RepID=A0A9Q8VEW9_9HYPO|nr:Transcription factor spt8 [Purpureocillium takamizusanense]UNI22247.1 Transcription factor spt8 [Purpureocillium takamizusanense]
MDEEDRFSASSAESERGDEPDEPMQDADEPTTTTARNNSNSNINDAEPEPDEDNNDDADADDDDDDDEGEGDNDPEGGDDDADAANNTTVAASAAAPDAPNENNASHEPPRPKSSKSATPLPSTMPWRPTVRPEALTAKLYDIVPTMAAPQSTSVNAMAITPDLRYWITGGSDGYIRKYDGPGTINGKLALTVAQKHPFVDSVTKAGILMSYWENEEPAPPGRGDQDHVLSPVYSLAVHSQALWLLSGLESGGINLQSVRHDEGKKIACLQRHTNAVSVLTLAPDEKSVLSGGWDKNIFDWDLNTGQPKRSFDGSGGQISSVELRPASGDPISAEADEPVASHTIATNNDAPMTNGAFHDHVDGGGGASGLGDGEAGDAQDGQASPAHESLFGGSDAGSLFGETAGEQPFGHDDDGYGAGMDMMGSHEGGMDYSADMAMTDMEAGKAADGELPSGQMQPPTQTQTQTETETDTQPTQDAMDIDGTSQAQAKGHHESAGATQAGAGASPRPATTQDGQTQLQDTPSRRLSEDKALLKSSPSPPAAVFATGQPSYTQQQQHDPSQTSATTFLSSAIDGAIRIWDRRVPNPVARIGNRVGVPPWCMSACWSPDGNMIYAGRRNGTVEEFDVRKARRGWEPERVLKFPAGSGAVSAVKPMVNGRHLVCASHDILRLYDLRETRAAKHSTVPFLIIPGPPRAGVISGLYVDPTSRFMLSAAGTRGWEGTSTEVLIGYEINVTE